MYEFLHRVGQKRKGSQRAYSVRITPKSRHHRSALALPICANSGREQPQQRGSYSITSSAWASTVGEIIRPSDCAVFILITTWNLVGCSTGKLAGWLPLMILST